MMIHHTSQEQNARPPISNHYLPGSNPMPACLNWIWTKNSNISASRYFFLPNLGARWQEISIGMRIWQIKIGDWMRHNGFRINTMFHGNVDHKPHKCIPRVKYIIIYNWRLVCGCKKYITSPTTLAKLDPPSVSTTPHFSFHKWKLLAPWIST